CVFDPQVQGELVYGRRALERDIETGIEAARRQLERRVQPLAGTGVRLRVCVRWDYPPHEAIIRQALRHKSDLVVAESRRHPRLARALLTNTDWQLIRLCPVPLLMVKASRPWKSAKVLAALDPFHAHAKPAALDPRILKVGAELARTLNGTLYAAHVCPPLIDYAVGVMTEPLPVRVTGREARQHLKSVRRKVSAEARRFGVDNRRMFVAEGVPHRELPKITRRLGARIVVMGAVSRSALKRLFIGSTAESVIDSLPDVCVVKPPGFRTPVPSRAPHLPVAVLP
ncbi:MAG TPA: universal stress protein, partial [Steroidobacteraceae bacterium]|nr:universal stress protein [Steroidobacteraceae bacterium]